MRFEDRQNCNHINRFYFRKMLGSIVWEIITCVSCGKYLGRQLPNGPQQIKVNDRKEDVAQAVERITSYAQEGVG